WRRVDLIVGAVAALLGGADELLDRRVGEVEQRAVRRGLGCLCLRHLFLRQLFLLRPRLDVACHEPPAGRSARAGSRPCRVADSLKGQLRLLKTSCTDESFGSRRKCGRNHLSFAEKFEKFRPCAGVRPARHFYPFRLPSSLRRESVLPPGRVLRCRNATAAIPLGAFRSGSCRSCLRGALPRPRRRRLPAACADGRAVRLWIVDGWACRDVRWSVAGIDMRISFSMSRRYAASSESQSEIATPAAPARAVRPMRCT